MQLGFHYTRWTSWDAIVPCGQAWIPLCPMGKLGLHCSLWASLGSIMPNGQAWTLLFPMGRLGFDCSLWEGFTALFPKDCFGNKNEQRGGGNYIFHWNSLGGWIE